MGGDRLDKGRKDRGVVKIYYSIFSIRFEIKPIGFFE